MKKQRIVAYISMGTNMGAKEKNLQDALYEISQLALTEVTAVSSLYCTAPVGYLEQEDFYNAVLAVRTELEPIDLLRDLLAIESKLGRVRTIRWGPRVVDLDLLLYGQEIIDLPGLIVPHPRMWERAFVLVPLAELVPDLQIHGTLLKEAVQNTSSQKIILFKRNWFGKL